MKQIKHIFIFLTIVATFLVVDAEEIMQEAHVSTQALFERVMSEAQKEDHEPEQLLSLVVTLLRHGVERKHQPLYAQAIFKLFSNIVKGMPYINAHTFSSSLYDMAECMPQYVHKGPLNLTNNRNDIDNYDNFKATVNSVLYCKFSNEYAAFKQDPEEFLQQLSQEIAMVNQYTMDLDKLRNTMVRFLELTLSKIIWSPEYPFETWQSVKDISQGLAQLFDHGVLEDVNDLDDLFWSLIHRYSYFLEVVGSLMPADFFQQIQNDIAAENILLFTLPEQDSFIANQIPLADIQEIALELDVDSTINISPITPNQNTTAQQ